MDSIVKNLLQIAIVFSIPLILFLMWFGFFHCIFSNSLELGIKIIIGFFLVAIIPIFSYFGYNIMKYMLEIAVN